MVILKSVLFIWAVGSSVLSMTGPVAACKIRSLSPGENTWSSFLLSSSAGSIPICSFVLALQKRMVCSFSATASRQPCGCMLPGMCIGSLSQLVRFTVSLFTISLMFMVYLLSPDSQLSIVLKVATALSMISSCLLCVTA